MAIPGLQILGFESNYFVVENFAFLKQMGLFIALNVVAMALVCAVSRVKRLGFVGEFVHGFFHFGVYI